MSKKPDTQESQRDALRWASDLVSSWDRFYSVLDMMEDSLKAEIQNTKGKGAKVDREFATALADEFQQNIFWLRQVVDEDARNARKSLEALGYSCGPKG